MLSVRSVCGVCVCVYERLWNARFYEYKTFDAFRFDEWCRIVRDGKCRPHSHPLTHSRTHTPNGGLEIQNLFIYTCTKSIWKLTFTSTGNGCVSLCAEDRWRRRRSGGSGGGGGGNERGRSEKHYIFLGKTKCICKHRQPMSTLSNDNECTVEMLARIIYPLLVWCHSGMDGILSLS